MSEVLLNTRHFIQSPTSLISPIFALSQRTEPTTLLSRRTDVLNKLELKAFSTRKYVSLSDSCKYRGLNNLGYTCYLNSAVQQFSRIPEIIVYGKTRHEK